MNRPDNWLADIIWVCFYCEQHWEHQEDRATHVCTPTPDMKDLDD